MFTHAELTLIDWMLETATENNPMDGELADLAEKVSDLLADGLDRLSDTESRKALIRKAFSPLDN